MSAVWVSSPSPHVTEAFSTLLHSIGYDAVVEAAPEVGIMICDLCRSGPPYPLAPSIPTLALVCTENDEELVDLLLLGYRGFLPRYIDTKELAAALEAVERREMWADKRVTSLALIRAFGGKRPLSVEQARLLVLVKQGLSNQEIAELLGLNVKQVKYQLSKSYKRLGIRGRGALRSVWKDHDPSMEKSG